LVGNVRDALEESDLNPKNLWLELTESASIENSEATLNMLADLRALNVHLCLDDFGTGFSSLSYLHKFPIDSLKIDKSFISRIDQNGNGSDVIRTILNLADQLRMNVVAEGVEEAYQLEFLRSENCDYAQGFYFSKPIEPKYAKELIIQDPHW
ncbi:MAG: EAL domain-containing protein, partial [Chloroflexi bacterium]|nr:EAL domain-containing protein [Chloroflexota bacterium]